MSTYKTHKAYMPTLFVGHGSPMCVITDNPYRKTWEKIGKSLPKPSAILCISAHWESAGIEVSTVSEPSTIHDFYGFPESLYDIHYPAKGAVDLAGKVQALLKSSNQTLPVVANPNQGLDHGAWAVLMSLFPHADVPVAQMSLAKNLSVAEHYALAKALAPLRDEGVMVMGSGNITHNLRLLDFSPNAVTMPWAMSFDSAVQSSLSKNDREGLINYSQWQGAEQSVPTREHYLPILYPAAMRYEGERLSFFAEGFDLGSISMRSFQIG